MDTIQQDRACVRRDTRATVEAGRRQRGDAPGHRVDERVLAGGIVIEQRLVVRAREQIFVRYCRRLLPAALLDDRSGRYGRGDWRRAARGRNEIDEQRL